MVRAVKMAKPSQPQQPGVSAAGATPPEPPILRDDPAGIAATRGSRKVYIYRSRIAAIPPGSDGCFGFPGVSRPERSTPGCCG